MDPTAPQTEAERVRWSVWFSGVQSNDLSVRRYIMRTSHRVSAYQETTIKSGSVCLQLQLYPLPAEAQQARQAVLVGVARFLSSDPEASALLAADHFKREHLLGGVAEVAARHTEPSYWLRETADVVAAVLTEAAVVGARTLYLTGGTMAASELG